PSLEAHMFWAGTYRDALPIAETLADAALERGELTLAAVLLSYGSRLRTALGDLAVAERDLVRLTELAERVSSIAVEDWSSSAPTDIGARAGNCPMVVAVRSLVWFEVVYCRGTGLEWMASGASAADAAVPPPFWRAAGHAVMAVLFTFAGRDEDALRSL